MATRGSCSGSGSRIVKGSL